MFIVLVGDCELRLRYDASLILTFSSLTKLVSCQRDFGQTTFFKIEANRSTSNEVDIEVDKLHCLS